MSTMPSPRAELQERLFQWLVARGDQFNAPYGVLEGQEKTRFGGRFRTVTFGRAATLDAVLNIWSLTNIDLKTSRGDWKLTSEAEVYDLLVREFGARP